MIYVKLFHEVSFFMKLCVKNYQNQPLFHEVIQQIKMVHLLKHGVFWSVYRSE